MKSTINSDAAVLDGGGREAREEEVSRLGFDVRSPARDRSDMSEHGQ